MHEPMSTIEFAKESRINKLPGFAIQVQSTKSEIRNKFKARMSKNRQISRVFDI